jgi:hypothetical protein
MRARTVPPRLLGAVWPLIEPWVTTALHRGNADLSADAVRQHIACGTMQLWLAWADGEPRPRGVWVTELLESSRGKLCNIVVLAGRTFERWHGLEAYLIEWARGQGCVRLSLVGRRGWLRRLKGTWGEAAVVMERQIDGRE